MMGFFPHSINMYILIRGTSNPNKTGNFLKSNNRSAHLIGMFENILTMLLVIAIHAVRSSIVNYVPIKYGVI